MSVGLSLRDRAILCGVGVLALYGLATAMWFMKFDREWKKSVRTYEAAVKTFRKETALIAKKGELQAQYEEEQEKIPVLTGDEPADTAWLEQLSTLADDYHVYVSGRKAGREEQEGVLNRLEIELEWDASLECLVKFLYALETAEHAMFDVRSIGVAASGRNTGRLKGKMTICCAYLREEGKNT